MIKRIKSENSLKSSREYLVRATKVDVESLNDRYFICKWDEKEAWLQTLEAVGENYAFYFDEVKVWELS